jgi:hypothetical protein
MATPTFIQPSPVYSQANAATNRFVVSGENRLYSTLDTVVDLAGLGNSFTVSGAIPIGLNLGTLTEIQQTIVGCSGLNVGSVETPTLWASLIYSSLASGTKTTDTNIIATSISRYTAADVVVLQASGGVFTSGKVKLRTCYVALV